MRKPTQNLIVDAAAFVAVALMLGSGFVLRYSLPPGSGSPTGAHGGGAREYLTVWGLTRHEWGDLHYWFSLALMGLLALHLVLHWQWISSMVRGRPKEGSGRRVALGFLGLAGVILLVIGPLLSPVERHEREGVSQRHERSRAPLAPAEAEPAGPEAAPLAEDETIRTHEPGMRQPPQLRDLEQFIRGDTFVGEAAARCGMTPAQFMDHFDLPAGTTLTTPLRRLQAAGHLTLADVRRVCARRDE